MEHCEENGHAEKKGSIYFASGQAGTRAYAECTYCKMPYQRRLTSKEYKEFDKAMSMQITI